MKIDVPGLAERADEITLRDGPDWLMDAASAAGSAQTTQGSLGENVQPAAAQRQKRGSRRARVVKAQPDLPFAEFQPLVADQPLEAEPGEPGADLVALENVPAIDGTVAPLLISSQALPESTGDDLLDQMLLEAAIAPTLAQRVLCSDLAARRRLGEPLPRAGTSYATRVILARAGIPYEAYLHDAGLRSLLARFGAQFPLATHAFENASIEKGGTLVAFVRRALDEMERMEVPVLRMHAGRDIPSCIWWADYMNLPRPLVSYSQNLRKELNKRLKAGTLKLGGVYKDPLRLTKARLRQLRNCMAPVLQRYRDNRIPVPAHPERADKFWFDPLLDEAGINNPSDRDAVITNVKFRREFTKLVDVVGLARVGTELARGVEVTYRMLLDREGEGVGLAREDYRRANPGEPIGGERETRHIDNQRSFLSRFRKANDRDLDDHVSCDFAEEGYGDRRRLGFTGPTAAYGRDVPTTKGDRQYCDSIDAWRDRAKAIQRAGVFPPTFCGTFATAMDLRQMDANALAKATGMPRRLVYNWRNGRTLPNLTNVHFVPLAEKAMSYPAGTLSSRLPELSSGVAYKGRAHMTLASGQRVQLSRWWRYLPKGAAGWPDEKLLPALEDAVARHSRRVTAASVRRSAAQRNIWGLPPEDPSSRIWVEWKDLLRFKRGLTGDHRVQTVDRNWNTDAAAGARRRYTSIFERWCRLPLEEGGLGLVPHQVSYRLLLNPAIGKRYLVWRLTRYQDLEHEGKALGIHVSSTEVNIAAFFSGLLDADFGWLSQSSAELGVPEVIDVKFRLPIVDMRKGVVEVFDDEGCPMVEVMPKELVERLERDWSGAAAEARRHAQALKSNLKKKFKLLLNPKDLITPIVRHAYPMAVMMRMIEEALKRVRPLESSPVRHARDYMRIVAALLLLLLVFRSETMRNLTWRADGTGELRFVPAHVQLLPDGSSISVPERYEVFVDAERFKNVSNVLLRGPSWNRKGYERELKDWGGLAGIIKHFIEVCRPILLDGRESDLLLPPPKPQRNNDQDNEGWSESNFNYLINSFTRMWCVYNRHTGTGMMGVQSFGPHPFRDIVATHIIKHWKGADRWELAALVLGTGELQVRQRYAWIDTAAELGKVDTMIDEAWRIAASDKPIW